MNQPDTPELAAYRSASESLLGLIRGERAASCSPEERRARAEAKLARTRRLLAALGNPHQCYPSIHLTGTSGKGSTCAAIAAIASAAGYRVGLRTSPYLQVMTEKHQIGPTIIDPPSFPRLHYRELDVARELFPSREPGARIGYAEIWTAISFLCFAERAVDLAVVEVGAGGRFDATNVLVPALSVITSVGLDHVVSLGPSLADIAWHKAGIIKLGAPVVIGDLPAEAESVVLEAAEMAGSDVIRQPPALPSHLPAMPIFQQRNAALAVTSLLALRPSGFAVSQQAIAAGLRARWLPGRLERMPRRTEPDVWIDGAHNPDKIDALMREWPTIGCQGRPPVLVVGVIGTKDAAAIVSRLAGRAVAVIATAPRVHGKRSLPASVLAAAFRSHGGETPVLVEPEPHEALRRARALAGEAGTDVLVTGSLFLAGELRQAWYPGDEIVRQRTPWPSIDPPSQDLLLRSVAR